MNLRQVGITMPGESLRRTSKPYRARSETWEHNHCEFCSAKFMDPGFSEAHRLFVQAHPDVLTEGYTTTAEHARSAACHWVCRRCFEDFADLFQWRVVAAD